MKIQLRGDFKPIILGVKLLADDLGIKIDSTGVPVYVTQRTGNLEVDYWENEIHIYYERTPHFFRALSYIENLIKNKTTYKIEEEVQFETCGPMIDCSRNAVAKVSSLKYLIRKLAVLGMDSLSLYLEDMYEVVGYPYFGYGRGRYTKEELQECDRYAEKLGITIIPCIQTLGHLTEALKWNYAAEMKDTEDILLIDESRSYNFIEKLLSTIAGTFRTRKVHIGMDEAHQVGLGQYLKKNGFRDRYDMMLRHLSRIIEICENLDLEPLMWSDMFFRLAGEGDYYNPTVSFPESLKNDLPDVTLVYWDYYHNQTNFYEKMIDKHVELSKPVYFAGGIWTWNGMAPNYGKTWETTNAALEACKNRGIKNIFATVWGDDGSETPFNTIFPGLVLYAEHCFNREVSECDVEKRFLEVFKMELGDYLLLALFDETPGISKNNPHESSPSKFLLWQDILLGLFDENTREFDMVSHYRNLSEKLTQVHTKTKEQQALFDFYHQFAVTLSMKANLGIRLYECYQASDKEEIRRIKEEMTELSNRVNQLRKTHRSLWMILNKPFGWEIIDIRYGGVLARLETAEFRLSQFLNGEIVKIDELEMSRLYFDSPWEIPEGSLGGTIYKRIVSASSF